MKKIKKQEKKVVLQNLVRKILKRMMLDKI
jgi:hypothetical protein